MKAMKKTWRAARRRVNFAPALVRRLRRCNRGAVALEFAFAAPIFILLVASGMDFGLGFNSDERLENAAWSGAQYAVTVPVGTEDAAGVDARVRDVMGDADGSLTVNVRYFSTCVSGGPEVTSDTCPGGSPPFRYIEVEVLDTHEFMFEYVSGMEASVPVGGRVVMRLPS